MQRCSIRTAESIDSSARITSLALARELQEQRVAALQNYLHPLNANERSGALH
jgi:hypothetical protein